MLVIEDEPKVARALRAGLERAGYEVTGAATGAEGFFLASAQSFDLILLDLMLPGRDGLEVLGTLRGRSVNSPVLILTARDADRVGSGGRMDESRLGDLLRRPRAGDRQVERAEHEDQGGNDDIEAFPSHSPQRPGRRKRGPGSRPRSPGSSAVRRCCRSRPAAGLSRTASDHRSARRASAVGAPRIGGGSPSQVTSCG